MSALEGFYFNQRSVVISSTSSPGVCEGSAGIPSHQPKPPIHQLPT